MHARLISESVSDDFSGMLKIDINDLWMQYGIFDTKLNISHGIGASNYNKLKIMSYQGWPKEFQTRVDDYLRTYRIETFGDKDQIEWEWTTNFLLINTIY